MNGYDVLWQPGTDHAGISTEIVVERNLEKENKSKNKLGEIDLSRKSGSGKASQEIPSQVN